VELLFIVRRLQAFGFDPGDRKLERVAECAVGQGFLQRFVAVFILDILSDDGDRDLGLRVVCVLDEGLPAAQVRVFRGQVQVLQDQSVDAFVSGTS
jgi:hypothetical protein